VVKKIFISFKMPPYTLNPIPQTLLLGFIGKIGKRADT
jgi:hypothetical protein